MSLLPQHYLRSVVQLKSESGNGTGFLIGVKTGEVNDKNESLYALFVVTNCHVVNEKRQISIRFDSESSPLDISIAGGDKSWVMCARKGVDLALIQISPEHLAKVEVRYNAILEEDIYSERETFRNSIEVGHEVFLLGFPLGINGVNRNYPIARQGIVARCDEELLSDGQFLLDINNFPGNSGGPVFLKPSGMALEGKTPIRTSYLIGLICAYLPYSKQLFDVTTSPPSAKMIMEENSGLAIAIPIHEAVSLARARIHSGRSRKQEQ